MNKHWTKHFLLFSSIVVVGVSLVSSFVFSNNSVDASIKKENFESIYLKTEIDFVIPSPSFAQVSELESNSANNSIEKVTPYYSFSTDIVANNKTIKVPLVILDDYSKVNYSPYCSNRMLKGEMANEDFTAMVDYDAAEQYHLGIGEKINLNLNNINYSFSISGITYNNTLLTEPSICLIIPNTLSGEINNEFRYSGAYVKSKDIDKCYRFLCNEYKPLGRLKTLEDFGGDTVAYERHVDVFNSTNWGPEITNLKENYSALSVKYSGIESQIITNSILPSIIILVLVVGFNTLISMLPSEKKYFKELLSKKSFKIQDVKKHYLLGNLYEFVIGEVLLLLIPFLLILSKNAMYFINILPVVIVPALALFIAELISISIELFAIKKYEHR